MRDGWEIKKLGEVCVIERGGSPRPIQSYLTDDPNGLNWIKIGDAVEGSKYIISTKERIIPEGLKKTRFVHKGDFLLSNSMSFGRPYILAIDGCIHDGWLVIHDADNRFDKSFLYYYLSSKNIYAEFKRLAVGGVVNNLNSELVRNVNVSIPPLAEQERIVAELDLLSGIIEKQKQQLKELDNLAQSIFYDMFGDPITNEKGWEVKTLGEVCTIERGGSPRPIQSYLTDSEDGINWIKIGDATESSKYITSTKEKIKPEGVKKSRFVHSGDFILSNSMSFGRPYILAIDGCIHDGWLVIHDKENTFDKSYLYYYLGSPSIYNEFKALAVGGVVNNLNSELVRKVKVVIPPLSLQQSFATKIEAIEKQKELVKQSLAETETLFNSRMDYYFSEE